PSLPSVEAGVLRVRGHGTLRLDDDHVARDRQADVLLAEPRHLHGNHHLLRGLVDVSERRPHPFHGVGGGRLTEEVVEQLVHLGLEVGQLPRIVAKPDDGHREPPVWVERPGFDDDSVMVIDGVSAVSSKRVELGRDDRPDPRSRYDLPHLDRQCAGADRRLERKQLGLPYLRWRQGQQPARHAVLGVGAHAHAQEPEQPDRALPGGDHPSEPGSGLPPAGQGREVEVEEVDGALPYTASMKTGLIVLGVIILIVIGGIGWAIGINNQLVGQEQVVNEKWAQVQNVYQRRADLIPNLVETVKGYATQERTVLEEVTKARASVAGIKATPELINDPAAFQKFQQAQNELGGALSRLLVTVERYPDLKSNQNFLTLQSQL